ncbi:hypothetical protein D3C81_2273040 [compost metagenome]
MGLAVHCQDHQAVEEGAQALGDETIGEGVAVAQHSHHVLVLEQSESRPGTLLDARIGRDAKLGDEVPFINR